MENTTIIVESGTRQITIDVSKALKGDTGATGPQGPAGTPTDINYNIVDTINDFNNLIAANTPGVWLINSDIVLDGNKTIPSGVTLKFIDTKIDLLTFTLTGSNTKLDSELYNIFTVLGSFSGSWDIDSVYTEWFGAVGDGLTDDTTAIQAAFDFISNINSGLDNLRLLPKTYNIGDTILMGSASVFFNGAKFNYTGALDRSAVVWGSTTTVIENQTLDDVNIVYSSRSWSDSGFAGLTLHSVFNSTIRISNIYGFYTGLQLWSTNNGVSINNFYLSSIVSNKIGIDFLCDGIDGGLNYINENVFIGGDIRNESHTSTLGDSYGVRFRAINGGYIRHNNNKFIGTSFQMEDGQIGDERIAVLFDDVGKNNFFERVRYESGRGGFAILNGTTNPIVNNEFNISFLSGDYVTATITETNQARLNKITNGWINTAYDSQHFDLRQNITAFNSTEVQSTGGLDIVTSSSGAILESADGFIARKESIEFNSTRGVGFYVSTDGDETFKVSHNYEDGYEARIRVAIFDEDFVRLTDVSVGAPHLSAMEAGDAHVYQTPFGGAYNAGVDVQSYPFRVSSSVKYLQVMVTGEARVKSISITRLTEKSKPLNIFSGRNYDYYQRLTSGDPSNGIAGVFDKGNVLWNQDAGNSNPSFYQVTTAGRLANTWITATAYDIQSIVETGGNIYVCVTAGTSSSAPTGTGTGITDGTVTWDYLCPKAVFSGSPALSHGGMKTSQEVQINYASPFLQMSDTSSHRFAGIRMNTQGGSWYIHNGKVTTPNQNNLYVSRDGETPMVDIDRSTGDVILTGTIKSSGYKSSDGSTGATGSYTAGSGETITVKNGLITSIV